MNLLVPVLTAVHDDMNASIWEEIKDLFAFYIYLYCIKNLDNQKMTFSANTKTTKLSFHYKLNWKLPYILSEGMLRIMFIIAGNGISDPSLNHGQSHLCFILC